VRYLFIILFFGVQLAGFSQESDYDKMLKEYYKNTVPTISPEDLYKRMKEGAKIHILDTRMNKEYEVSSIKGAVRVGMSVSSKKMETVEKNDLIVVYCTIGARSESVGEKIKKAGYRNVYNLYGGIIEWVNKGYPVYNKGTETDSVHVFSKEWGKWLEKGTGVY